MPSEYRIDKWYAGAENDKICFQYLEKHLARRVVGSAFIAAEVVVNS